MKDLSSLFIPLCGVFGVIAGFYFGGGGINAVLGAGIGLIIGVVFRFYQQNKRR